MFKYHKVVIVLLSFFSCIFLNAQTSMYHEFPDSNTVWNFEVFSMSCLNYYSLLLSGDTTIKSKAYHKLFKSGFKLSSNPSFPYPCDTTIGYKGAIREDIPAKKVYFIPRSDTTERLLYDFNMQVGDTLKGYLHNTFYSSPDSHFVIASIDSVQVGFSYRKRWNVNNCYGYQFKIIEGVGAVCGLIEPYPGCYVDMVYYDLLCFKQDGQTLYPNTSDSCNVIITDIRQKDVLPIQNALKVYPNPSNGHINIILNSNVVREIRLMDMFGRVVYHQQNPVQNEIQIHQLSSGAYILTVVDDKNRMTNTKIINYP